MRKFLLLSVIFLSCHYGFAQSYGTLDNPDVGESKSNAFFVGPKIGGSLAFVSGQPKECDLFDGGGFGVSGGVAMKVRFGRATENSLEGTGMFGIGLELKYRQAKAKTIGDNNLSLDYFEIPVMLQFYPKTNSIIMNGLYVEAGPDFAIPFSKSPDVINANEFVKYHTGDLKARDCRIAIASKIELLRNISFVAV